jgi:hypothetical protein
MALLLKPFQWLQKAAGYRLLWLGVPLLLYVPTVAGPFVFDDLLLVLRAERYASGESSSLDLFRFAPSDRAWQDFRDRGTFPWWAPERLRIDFFRPLAEWSFYLDMLLFGRNAAGHRLVSLAWFAAALLCLHKLYARASGDPVRAGAATFFFGICQTVTQPATFICNRNDLMVVVGTTLAAEAYWSTAAGSGLRKTVFAGAAFAGALLSKEIAVGLAGIVVLHALLPSARRSSPAERSGRRRIACVIAILAICYLTWFAATRPWHLGLGGQGELSNIGILAQAPRAIPLYLAVWTTGFPISSLFHASTMLVIIVGAAGLLATGLLIPSLRRLVRTDQAATFFMLWGMIFLAIALLTFTEARALCVATVGWAYLLAGLLTAPAPLWLRHWLLATNGTVSLCCAIGTVIMQTRFESQLRDSTKTYLQACGPLPQSGDLLVMGEAKTGLELLFTPERLEFLTGLKGVSVAFLTLPDGNRQIRREGDRTLVYQTADGDLLDQQLYRLSLGQDEKRRPGQAFKTRHFTAEVRQVDGRGRVTSLAFRFVEPLTSPRLHFQPADVAAVARGEQ